MSFTTDTNVVLIPLIPYFITNTNQAVVTASKAVSGATEAVAAATKAVSDTTEAVADTTKAVSGATEAVIAAAKAVIAMTLIVDQPQLANGTLRFPLQPTIQARFMETMLALIEDLQGTVFSKIFQADCTCQSIPRQVPFRNLCKNFGCMLTSHNFLSNANFF